MGLSLDIFKLTLPEGVPWDVLQDLAAQAFDRIGAAHHRIDTPSILQCTKLRPLTILFY